MEQNTKAKWRDYEQSRVDIQARLERLQLWDTVPLILRLAERVWPTIQMIWPLHLENSFRDVQEALTIVQNISSRFSDRNIQEEIINIRKHLFSVAQAIEQAEKAKAPLAALLAAVVYDAALAVHLASTHTPYWYASREKGDTSHFQAIVYAIEESAKATAVHAISSFIDWIEIEHAYKVDLETLLSFRKRSKFAELNMISYLELGPLWLLGMPEAFPDMSLLHPMLTSIPVKLPTHGGFIV